MAMKTKVDLGSKYKTGDKNPVSGNFVCEDCEKAGKHHAMSIKEGDKFPQCSSMNVTWRLESYEPTA
jgi:hypothetical protein